MPPPPWNPDNLTDYNIWESEYLQDHPLVGKIWSVSSGKFISSIDLVADIADKTFVLLGEKHNNIDHHRIQAWIVGQLLNSNRKMALAFEMLEMDKTEILNEFNRNENRSAADIAGLTDWQSNGWPSWSLYQPIAQHAVDAGLPILATIMTRQQARGMVRKNETFLDAQSLSRMRLDRALPPTLIDIKTKELIHSHCNMMPEKMVEPMLRAQTTKDAMMADVMIAAENQEGLDGAILITGGGHARNDWAVPWHLAQRVADKSVSALAMVEVIEDFSSVEEYSEQWDVADIPFDYIWFTPRTDIDDPCGKFAEQLEGMGKTKQNETKAEPSDDTAVQ